MIDDVRSYITTCQKCQQSKIFPSKAHSLLQPIPPSTAPWSEITADFITGLPKSSGYNAIFVVVDHFTKRAHFILTTSQITAEGTAQLYHNNIWKNHGWPKKIISDHGTQFAAQFAKALNKSLGIETALSSTYHPQTDG
jgi:hypothetical protein